MNNGSNQNCNNVENDTKLPNTEETWAWDKRQETVVKWALTVLSALATQSDYIISDINKINVENVPAVSYLRYETKQSAIAM